LTNAKYIAAAFFHKYTIFVQLNFLILKWCTTQCPICTISFLKNMCCVCWFSNNNRNICKRTQLHILLKQTNWKLNWLINNPLDKQFRYFSAFQILFSNIIKASANRCSYIVFFSCVVAPICRR